jgi:hypothetical protein
LNSSIFEDSANSSFPIGEQIFRVRLLLQRPSKHTIIALSLPTELALLIFVVTNSPMEGLWNSKKKVVVAILSVIHNYAIICRVECTLPVVVRNEHISPSC